jgi:hypothetical protein
MAFNANANALGARRWANCNHCLCYTEHEKSLSKTGQTWTLFHLAMFAFTCGLWLPVLALYMLLSDPITWKCLSCKE